VTNWQETPGWFTIGAQKESAGFDDLKGYVNSKDENYNVSLAR
jgi:hypothetical protein